MPNRSRKKAAKDFNQLARAIGIANRTWTIRDIVELLPAACHSTRF
jgi:hypothetical protein